jgi:PPOX class probable F420-dependent enzyme
LSRCYAGGGNPTVNFEIPQRKEEAMAGIPQQYLDLLTTKKAFAHLATQMKDGSPQVTPVWMDFTDGMIRVNTARGRVKDRNLKVGSRVALSISDPDNPYRYVQIRGKVVKETEQGADAHIDSLAKKYMGVDSYPYRNAAEKRVIYSIEPTSGQGMN